MQVMGKVIAIIPARSGSKGVPNKNIRLLAGQPLIAWSIKASLMSKCIDRVIVSTDSEEYQRLSIELGAEAPFLRPPEISGDFSTDYDCILHALDWLSLNGGEPEYLVHLRPTTPFRNPEIIDEAINIFQHAPGQVTALRSAHEMSESAYKTFEIATQGCFKRVGADQTSLDFANNARQGFPVTYQANGYVDVLSTRFIRENALLHGNWVMPFITTHVVEVDTEEDFRLLEYQLKNMTNPLNKLLN
jgi:N-acylneuraminate cytidylyltransferase